MSSFSSTNNNSKIAAGPLSGNEVSQKGGAHVPIYLSHDDEECEDQSETDDEEERLEKKQTLKKLTEMKMMTKSTATTKHT